MARIARIVVPGVPHHLTQRGNRRQLTFFKDKDYEVYLDLLVEGCRKANVQIWAYCLMPNHVHLILVPDTVDGLRATAVPLKSQQTQLVRCLVVMVWGNSRDQWHQRSSVEQVELEQVEDAPHGQGAFAGKTEEGQHQINAQSHPDLCFDGVEGCSQERLDLEVLFDPFEEKLDLPPLFVDIGDGPGRQGPVVGEEVELFPGDGIPECDAPDQAWILFLTLLAGECDQLIFHDAVPVRDRQVQPDVHACTALETRYEKDAFLVQAVIPGVCPEPPVEDDDAALRQFQGLSPMGFGVFSIGE